MLATKTKGSLSAAAPAADHICLVQKFGRVSPFPSPFTANRVPNSY